MNAKPSGQFDELPDLDRLVDGELSERERTELLGHLERHPEGWRRLALAFLEAQTWGEAAREHVADAMPQATQDIRPAESDDAPRRGWKLTFGTSLAMAASFLVAFTLGIALRGALRSNPPIESTHQVATHLAQQERAARKAMASAQGDFAATLSSLSQKINNRSSSESGAIATDAPESESLASSDSLPLDQVEEVWLPADADTSDESTLAGSPAPAVPEQVLRSLRRLGHEVESHQSLWPVDLKNGQRALVPVDEVEIRYVGNDYQ